MAPSNLDAGKPADDDAEPTSAERPGKPAAGETKPPADAANDFTRQAGEKPPGLIAEFVDFLIHNKKWWLTPIILVLLLLGVVVWLGGTSFAPFIYPAF